MRRACCAVLRSRLVTSCATVTMPVTTASCLVLVLAPWLRSLCSSMQMMFITSQGWLLQLPEKGLQSLNS